MNEFKMLNKKITKTNSTTQVLTSTSPTTAAVPQIQHNEPQQMRIHPDVKREKKTLK